MNLSLTEDQVALRDAVRHLLADRCTPTVVRAAWPGGDESIVDTLWAELAGLGLLGAMAPESAGGLGLDETDLVPVLVETGYAAAPLPVVETAFVAVPLLATAGDVRLAGVRDGRVRVAIAGPDWLVPFGQRADLVLSLAGGVATLSAPVASRPESTVDGSRAAVRAKLPAGGVLTRDPALVATAIARYQLGAAAQLVGLGRRMLDLTVSYVGSRRQFGAPVGSFQAVGHQLADALLGLEFAEPAVHAAGWALAHHTGAWRRDVSTAVILATEAAQRMAKTAIQCHGAIGYTVEYDLHLYAKRTWALAATVDLDAEIDRVADALELP